MERFIAWLLELSSGTIYAVIGLTTLVENVFPPTPSDVAVALGGFLSQHQRVSPIGVWAVACLANLGGTFVVYFLARKYGPQFRASRLGTRLLPPDAILALEREYLRFGIVGIFLGRLLPGFRSVVAPFAGLVSLPTATALIPITLATMVWYAFLAWIGARLGAEWASISRFIGQLNRTLGILAVLAGIVIAVIVLRRRKTKPVDRDLLLRTVHRALETFSHEAPVPQDQNSSSAGAATLLYELARADREITGRERDLITTYLRDQWKAKEAGAPSQSDPSIQFPLPKHTAEMASQVSERFEHDRRVALLNRLFCIANSDGALKLHEERLLIRAAALLGLTAVDLEDVRRRNQSGV
jgi:membrane protein DedA with SNARE-associated domain/uncharacterized tellurite resistance protein B-like protein